MLDLAEHIVDQKSGHFEPDRFEDHYETALQELLDKKQKGLPIAKAARPSIGNVINLMDALKANLNNAGKSEPAAKPGKAAKKAAKSNRKAW
jgi:DNA end-binding protein Ku